VKTITIHLPDVEATMLAEVQKWDRAFKGPGKLVLGEPRQEYQSISRIRKP